MVKYKCRNCGWEGVELSITGLIGKCPVCGDEVDELADLTNKQDVPKEDILDLNRDGKVDGKDASIAGKVLAASRKKKRRKKK